MDLRLRTILPVAAALLFAACAQVTTRPPQTPVEQPITPAHPGRYEAVPGRDAEVIAELRAAPAPPQAEVSDSQSPEGDKPVLAAKGYVHIGDGEYRVNSAEGRDWLIARAHDVGADKVMIYAAPGGNDAAALHAVYYVRFKLPFGANFRDLRAEERDALGASGVHIGAVIGNSPADQASLRDGDVVLKFNGEAVRDRADFEQRLRAHMGKKVTLVISRDGTVVTRLVRLGVLASELDGHH
jgi:hypothetical protein